MTKKYKFSLLIFGVILIAVLYEIFRDTFTRMGDFKGYVLVGNLTLNGEDIYTDPSINTWPPLYSVICVPIALLDNFSRYISRFIWLLGSLVAMAGIVNYTVKLTLNRSLTIFKIKSGAIISNDKISIIHWIVLIPLLISLRYILDNFSNIQINIFMLWFALASIHLYNKNKNILAALILAFSISMKVYTVFLLLYFIIKREYKIAGYTILFCVLFSCLPFLVYGFQQTIDYYIFWYNATVEPFARVAHKNQSYFSLVRRLLMHESPGLNQPLNKEVYINIFNLSLETVKKISYGLLALLALPVIGLFREKIIKPFNLKVFIEFSFILNIIPLLSPLGWKAYFIFLFPSYFISYLFIYQHKNELNKPMNNFIKVNYFISIILTVFSSEMFVGSYFSDIMEVCSCITLGAFLIAINLIIFHIKYSTFEKKYE